MSSVREGQSPAAPVLREIPRFPSYLAGANGRIYQKASEKDIIQLVDSVYKGSQGDLEVNLFNPAGASFSMLVSSLVALAWLDPPLPGYELCHINGHKGDNRPENLEWRPSTKSFKNKVKEVISNVKKVF